MYNLMMATTKASYLHHISNKFKYLCFDYLISLYILLLLVYFGA